MKQLSCAQCRARWDDLISGSTLAANSPESAEVQAHLASCADCRKAFDLLVAARRELQQLPAQKAPATLRASILNQIKEQPKPTALWRTWTGSFSVSPQRVAWAGSALVAVFLVALLMRPERQAAVLQTTPPVLSNRAQIQQHNNPQGQPVAPVITPTKKDVVKKSTKKTSNKTIAATANNFSHHRESTITRPMHSTTSKPKPVPPTPTPTPTPKHNQEISALPAPKPILSPPLQKSLQPKTTSPQAEQTAPAASTFNGQAAAPLSLQGSMGQPQSGGANGPAGPNNEIPSMTANSVAPPRAFKARKAPEEIHWSKTITADQDVANAEISIELESGLAFADATGHHTPQRVLWKGALHQGQQIPLTINLLRTSNQNAKLHLRLMDDDTQKVLWDEVIPLPDEQ